MTPIEIYVDRYKATPKVIELGTEGSYGNEVLHLNLSEDYDGLVVHVDFAAGGVSVPVGEDGLVEVPAVATENAGRAELKIVGYRDGVKISTVPVVYVVQYTIHDQQGDPPEAVRTLAEQLIDAAADAVAEAGESAAAAAASAEEAAQIAKKSWKPTVSDSGNLSWELSENNTPPETKNVKGDTGADGADGFSPTISTAEITGGHRVTATDKDGAHVFDVMDGENGILPEITVTTSPGATVTVKKGAIESTYTAGGTGVLAVSVPEYGTWEIIAEKDGGSGSKTVSIDAVRQYSVTVTIGKTYGVEWNRVSSPVWTRTDDAALFPDPVPYVAGMAEGDWGSPFDTIMPWAGMAIVDDPAAGKLVAIPKFYYKWTVDAAKMKLQISAEQKPGFFCSPAHMDRGDGKGERDIVYVGRYHCSTANYKSESGVKPKASITRATARDAIRNLGQGIWQIDHAMWWTINMLYLVEFANANCQGTVGYGRGNGSSTENMGYTDAMPYHTGTMRASKTQYGCSTQYRYIEGLWDNVVDWCDGIYFSGANVYHILNPEQFSDSTNGTLTGTRATTDVRVITGFTFPNIEGYEWAGYPGSADIGSAGTTGENYFCDNEYYASGGVVMNVGGSYSNTQSGGLFYRYGSSSTSHTYADIGARLQKLP